MTHSSEAVLTDNGRPVSVDDTIDDIARRALEEARRKEELERLRKEPSAVRDSAGNAMPCQPSQPSFDSPSIQSVQQSHEEKPSKPNDPPVEGGEDE
jgi:hypothetical protein